MLPSGEISFSEQQAYGAGQSAHFEQQNFGHPINLSDLRDNQHINDTMDESPFDNHRRT